MRDQWCCPARDSALWPRTEAVAPQVGNGKQVGDRFEGCPLNTARWGQTTAASQDREWQDYVAVLMRLVDAAVLVGDGPHEVAEVAHDGPQRPG